MATITTTYMGLLLPVVGVEPGPQYATDNNNAFIAIDQHNHAPGAGVQVPSAGININADLAFGGFNANILRSTRYVDNAVPLALAADKDSLYFVLGAPYYNDLAGNPHPLGTGAGAITYAQETPVGVVNSINTVFTLSNAPVSNSALKVYLDGLILKQGTDYTVVGVTITMTTAPLFGQTVYADYSY